MNYLLLPTWTLAVYVLYRLALTWDAAQWEVAGTVLMWVALTAAMVAVMAALGVLRR